MSPWAWVFVRLVQSGSVAFLDRLKYVESELDPVIHAEILVESSRNEARVAVLEILFALGFGVVLGFGTSEFQAVALFALFTVSPLLLDAVLRRRAAARVMGRDRPGPEAPGLRQA